ncbi:hypothetical protein [Adlercreutzia sp. ZJ141]|uniref:hypothetical protein n=1 Tax=Adlercreutzia sp. ZJ141 TaxID=2709406 RepID=UPI0013ED6969|nr:hypothetical protein [Adlercreutzia sp. ZJ141]
MKRLNVGINDFMRSSSVYGLSKKAIRVAQVHAAWRRAVEEVYSEASGLILMHTNAVYIMKDTDNCISSDVIDSETDSCTTVHQSEYMCDVGLSVIEFGVKEHNNNGSSIDHVTDYKRVSRETRRFSPKQLIVYSDDSMVRSDLDARQEFLKMRLRESGEYIEKFKILPSKMDMRSRHPFLDEDGNLKKGSDVNMSRSERFKKLEVPAETFDMLINHVEDIDNEQVKKSLDKAIRANLSRSKDIS